MYISGKRRRSRQVSTLLKIGLSVCLSVVTTHVNLKNRTNAFHKIRYKICFEYEKTMYIGLILVKKKKDCLPVRERIFRLYREPLYRLSQNLVLYIFLARQNDLDRFQPCKKWGCWYVCLSVNTSLVNLEDRSNYFHKTRYYMHFVYEKTIQIGLILVNTHVPVYMYT